MIAWSESAKALAKTGLAIPAGKNHSSVNASMPSELHRESVGSWSSDHCKIGRITKRATLLNALAILL